jgi:hypothetical protein
MITGEESGHLRIAGKIPSLIPAKFVVAASFGSCMLEYFRPLTSLSGQEFILR